MTLRGRCHCGNLELELETAIPAGELPLRECQCTFCRRHGARNTSDPAGRLTVRVRDAADFTRYRFGLGITDFLLCRCCGVYVAATMPGDGGLLATVNVNVMDDLAPFDRPAKPMVYDAESSESRLDRRRAAWMPAGILDAVAEKRR